MRRRTAPMLPHEIAEARGLAERGVSAREIGAALGRHERTVRRAIRLGDELIDRRSKPMRPRSFSEAEREAARERQRGSGSACIRPQYLRAAAWTPEWFHEQATAFVAAMRVAHPELEVPLRRDGGDCLPARESATPKGSHWPR